MELFLLLYFFDQHFLDLEKEQTISSQIHKKLQSSFIDVYLSVYYIYIQVLEKEKLLKCWENGMKITIWTFLSKWEILSVFFNIHKTSFWYISTTLMHKIVRKNPRYNRFALSVFFITLEQCYIKNLNLWRYTSFMSKLVWSTYSGLKVTSRLFSSSTKWTNFFVHSSDLSAFVIDILYTFGQRSKQVLWNLLFSYQCKY